jgi:hypothetical protein
MTAMTPSTASLFRTAGLCAAAAGAIFIGVQINHPPADVAHLVTSQMTVREAAKALMAVLALVGFTGMFLWQRRRLGALGCAGYLLLSIGFLALFAIECIVGFVLPTVAHTDPQYVQHVLNAAVGSGPHSGIGHMQELFLLSGIGYPLGGLLFGIAMFRAGMLARWAAALLAVATTSVVALAALPESFNRPFAVPAGVALIGLGVSFSRSQRRDAHTAEPAVLAPEPVAI